VYESVVWFIVGCFVSGVGGALGSVRGLWAGWAASVLAGVVGAWVSRRLSLIAGAAVVSATLGALTANNLFVAALAALGSVLFPATALWNALLTHRTPSKPSLPPQSEPEEAPAPPLLEEGEIEAILRLAETDSARFRERLRALTPQQREQLRRALHSRRTG